MRIAKKYSGIRDTYMRQKKKKKLGTESPAIFSKKNGL